MSDKILLQDIVLPGIHTLQSDMAQAEIKRNAPQPVLAPIPPPPIRSEGREIPVEKKSSVPSHVLRNFVISFIAIVIVAGSGYGILNISKKRSEQPPIIETPIVVTKTQKIVSYSSTVSYEIGESPRAESEGITWYKTSAPLKNILPLVSPSIPDELVRSFGGSDFFGGSSMGNFMIIETDSYEIAYPAMLEWEKTMKADLYQFFSVATTTPPVAFRDVVVANRDIRKAVDIKAGTLFVYGFSYDKKFIILAQNENTYTYIYDMLLR